VHEASEKDVDIAVAAARKQFNGGWRDVTPNERGRLLMRLADLIDRDIKTLAAIESLDNGKSITMATGDVGYASACLRYYGGWADKIEGKVVDTGSDTFNYVKKEPVCYPFGFPTCCVMDSNIIILDRCLRSDHPMELPSTHVGMEDWPSGCLR